MIALQVTMESALLSGQRILELTETTNTSWVLAAISTLTFRTSSKTILEFSDSLFTWPISSQDNPLNWRVTLPSVRMLRIIKIQLKWLEAEKLRKIKLRLFINLNHALISKETIKSKPEYNVKTKYYYFFVGYNKKCKYNFGIFFWNFWKMCHLRNVHGHFTQMSLIQMYVWKK